VILDRLKYANFEINSFMNQGLTGSDDSFNSCHLLSDSVVHIKNSHHRPPSLRILLPNHTVLTYKHISHNTSPLQIDLDNLCAHLPFTFKHPFHFHYRPTPTMRRVKEVNTVVVPDDDYYDDYEEADDGAEGLYPLRRLYLRRLNYFSKK
jgi:hypothetical protein